MKLAGLITLTFSPILLACMVAFSNPRTFFDYNKTGGWNIVILFGVANASSCLILAGTSGVRLTPTRD
jgi:hypothetical protein